MKYKADILVVDDEAPICRNISTILQGEGLHVDCALSGEEAMAKEAEKSYALAIVDMMMPGMDGYEVTRQLRSVESTAFIPIILFTA